MEAFIYSDVNKESCTDREGPKSIHDVNDESYRDRRQPRLIQDREIPVPLHGTLDEVQGKKGSMCLQIETVTFSPSATSLCHIFSSCNYEIFQCSFSALNFFPHFYSV